MQDATRVNEIRKKARARECTVLGDYQSFDVLASSLTSQFRLANLHIMIRSLAFFATLMLTCVSSFAQSSSTAKTAKASDGVSIYVCGHSFHQFIAEPLAALAKEAGMSKHRTAEKFYIGGSNPLQIWDIPDTENPTRAALRQGNIDILTLSPNIKMPDKGITLYADYAIKYNPRVRVMLQLSWPPNLTGPDTNWAMLPLLYQVYRLAAESQVQTINRAHEKSFVTLVPVAIAFFKLREKIDAGEVSGISKVSDLFVDETGHASSALQNLTTYCWFAAVYDKSPEGLTALDSPKTATSADTNLILQKIAWNVVGKQSVPSR
ncbi:MAG TPA: hypothetical protein VK970_24745 [Candidatus Methylacidiphilales bacterium]|nr:hypothetical protein [Candidatus Methylacidiphilales bacterium]